MAGALLCVWDMVKYLEKDPAGNYPDTAIGDIRVLTTGDLRAIVRPEQRHGSALIDKD